MHIVKDKRGREWRVELSPASLAASPVAMTLLCPGSPATPHPIMRLMNDPIFAGDALWALCEPQAKALGIDHEAFEGAIDGTVLEAAADALINELIDGSPKRERWKVRAMWEEVKRRERDGWDAMQETLKD